MKSSVKLLFILFFIFILSDPLRASDEQNTDSLKISRIVSDFYTWYLNAINNEKHNEYMPRFIANESGMTTIDYSNYIKNLKKYYISDSLIIKEIKSYQACKENLKFVKYSDFEIKFNDLDEFERAQCDFGNYYRWIGGQEPIGGIRIKEIQYINTEKALVTVDYYDINDKDSNKFFYGENKVGLIKIKNQWYIDSVDSWNLIFR
ncbi:MAG: hypothetical protein J7604_00420 [Sporocytophaga sp.]|uniref:hypothetical protein n=1 Tax=Sporocytophaga sp. TaxID=2231183 RepID=UPI001B0ABC56|nr:hypothetical protein [Sporocytophaga sp.]MBO9698633.1 hypothetical protein [Sporocytophaga sp.]